jgi:isoleucyl-tRNA synthetase
VFTAEETWQVMPRENADSDISSVHLAAWPKSNPAFAQSDLQAIIEMIPDIAKALEEKRAAGQIGSSFDAQIILLTNSQNRYNYVASLKPDLLEIFKVSQVSIEKTDEPGRGAVSKACPEVAIEVKKADGAKCVRCWNYSIAVGKFSKHPEICDKCLVAIGEVN